VTAYLWLTPIILATKEAEIRRITAQDQSRQIVLETLSPKYLEEKWTGGVAQVAEHLLCKHEALSSNPSSNSNKNSICALSELHC
jgi:hypothetical protein